jgi:hypothetical protein
MNITLEPKFQRASNHARALGSTTLMRPVFNLLLLCILTGIAVTDIGFAQEESAAKPTPKPIGTVNTPTSKVINLPAANVELMSIDGRKIIATVHKFEGSGIKIQTADGAIHNVAYNKLSWETIAKLTGQELSYTKAGMDGFWVMGEAKCSRSR